MTKQAKQQNSHSKVKRRVLIVVAILVLVLGFSYYALFGADQLRARSYSRLLNQVPVPSSWHLESKTTEPVGLWGTCVSHIDLGDCPNSGRTYKTVNDKDTYTELESLYRYFETRGYKAQSKCLEDSCGNQYSRHYFNMTKGRTAVGASVKDNGSTKTIDIGIGVN